MSKEITNVQDLQSEIDKDGQLVEEINVLFLDASSTCIGYSICSLNFKTKKSTMKRAGAIWLDPNWEHAEKYSYVYNMIVNYFWVVEQIDHIVIEQYSINVNKMMGAQVLPEMIGCIKAAAWEHGVKVSNILPQSWRSQLGIKADVTIDAKGKKTKDYKDPAKRYVDSIMNVPPMTKSNITGIKRATPSDLYDGICVALGWNKKLGFTKTDVSSVEINPHIPK